MKCIFIYCLLLFIHLGKGQIGVKTHYPASGNLLHNASSIQPIPGNASILYHPIAPIPVQPGQPQIQPIRPQPVDPITMFINQTRSRMASGICYTEVPTESLVLDKTQGIPAGNGSSPSMSKIQICCEGYERNPHIFKQCDPICKDGCPNGICVAPNECKCLPDAIRNVGGFCLPTCPIGCGNGVCLPDGTCQCKPGFVIEPITRKYCIPFCSKGCVNGNCTAPDLCQCNLGFVLSSDGKCTPKCDNCLNGECVAPGQCRCAKGYIKMDTGCVPVCSRGCNNGICTAPDVCTCKPGWELDSTKTNCVAHCDRPCLNGFCGGPNTCLCNTGYIIDPTNDHVCIPHCPDGCPNGYCTSPNFCVCKPGFIKDHGIKGRQRCVPAV